MLLLLLVTILKLESGAQATGKPKYVKVYVYFLHFAKDVPQ